MFICLEGIDGAGKSTQVQMLRDRLTATGVEVVLFRDPGTTKLGKALRSLLLDRDDDISPAAQMLLFCAARAELSKYVADFDRPGVFIICDRWVLSTLVYQTTLNGLDPEFIMQIFNATSVLPDLCVLLDIDPVLADARKADEPRQDRYERRALKDKALMRAAYLRHAQATRCARNTIIVNANASQEVVSDKIVQAVLSCLPSPVQLAK